MAGQLDASAVMRKSQGVTPHVTYILRDQGRREPSSHFAYQVTFSIIFPPDGSDMDHLYKAVPPCGKLHMHSCTNSISRRQQLGNAMIYYDWMICALLLPEGLRCFPPVAHAGSRTTHGGCCQVCKNEHVPPLQITTEEAQMHGPEHAQAQPITPYRQNRMLLARAQLPGYRPLRADSDSCPIQAASAPKAAIRPAARPSPWEKVSQQQPTRHVAAPGKVRIN